MENNEKNFIRDYLSKLYYESLNKIPNRNSKITDKIIGKVNYYLGVPIKHLTENKINNFSDLVKITLKHKREPSPHEKELDLETEQYLQLV